MPRYYRRPGEEFRTGLRAYFHVSFAGWIWHSSRRRHRLCWSTAGGLLRFVVGESDCVGYDPSRGLPAHGPGAPRIPHSRREDKYSVPENVVNHPRFRASEVTTSFLDESPELFRFTGRADRATKLLSYLGDVILNGDPRGERKNLPATIEKAPLPAVPGISPPAGTRQLLQKLRPKKFAASARKEKRLLLTDTTFRDARQSLMATVCAPTIWRQRRTR